MRTNFASAVAGLTLLCLVPRSVIAQGTAFTYQGLLNDTNGPANGSYDLQFLVFDAAEGGIQQGLTLNRFGLAVSNGLFTTTLDYGANIFTGLSRWLEIRVAPFETSAFTTLAPRQALTPTPYAMYAPNAGTAAGATSVAWLALTGVPAGLADGVDDNTLYSAGSGLSLAGTIFSLNTAFTDARYDGRYWKLTGNSGTTAGVDFLGTTDNQALEIKVNNARVLRLEPATDGPNVIGGAKMNYVAPGVSSATIAGGGTFDYLGTPATNRVTATAGTIGGGVGNNVGGSYSTIAGGLSNDIFPDPGYALYATIGGGALNTIDSAVLATIGGGNDNKIESRATFSTIGGGNHNLIRTNAFSGTIGGGHHNTIQVDAIRGTISGGTNNTIQTAASFATIGGGMDHSIAGTHGTIAGGEHHTIEAEASYTSIGGGSDNAIQFNADYSTVAGGDNHIIRTNATWATIGGGANNLVETNASYAVIPGGGYALARHHGQMAHASGRFASNGDAQTSLYVLRRTLNSSTPSELFLNGSSLRMTVPVGSTWTFEALVVARSSTGESAGYRLTGVVENVGGGLGGTFQAPQVLREDVAAWDASAHVDNVNDALTIEVTGTAGTTIRWVASVRTVEVTY